MRDEPQGRYVSRIKGRGVTAKRFHLYNDCGMLVYAGEDPETSEGEILAVGERDIDLLGLTVCSVCDNRSKDVGALDVIADAIEDQQISDEENFVHPINEEDALAIADDVIAALEKHGYSVAKRRKGMQ